MSPPKKTQAPELSPTDELLFDRFFDAIKDDELNNRVGVVRSIIKDGLSVNKEYYSGIAWLMALDWGRHELLGLLFEHGADATIYDEMGTIQRAVDNMHGKGPVPIETIKLLISKGADVNTKSTNNSTAVITAAYAGPLELLKFLVEAGGDLSHTDKNGWDATVAAKKSGQKELIAYVKEQLGGKPEKQERARKKVKTVNGIASIDQVKSSGVDGYLIFATNHPQQIEPDEYSAVIFPGSRGAGCLVPPSGLGYKVFAQKTMDKSEGTFTVKYVMKHIEELKVLLEKHFDVCALELDRGFKQVGEGEFVSALNSGRFSHIKVVHIENE